MFEVLDRVREKPKAERQAIAFGAAGVVTGVIFIAWAISFFAFVNEQEDVTKSGEQFGIGAIMDSLQEANSRIRKEVGTAQEQLEYISSELQKGEPKTSGELEVSNVEDTQQITPPIVQEPEITPSGVEIIQI